MTMPSKHVSFAVAVLGAVLCCGVSHAKDIYIAQSAAGSADGTSCANAYAATFFNAPRNWGLGVSQIGPGTKVHLCGTYTGAAGSTAFTFQGSGTRENPITLLFEANALLQAPYWAAVSAGAINMNNRSYITVDGGANGVLQNTANGDKLVNIRSSTGVSAFNCNNCTVRNLQIANIYVHSRNGVTHAQGLDQTMVRGIEFSGSNWTINNNSIYDCGWCLFNGYANGDTNISIYNNEIYNFDHAWMLASSSANSMTNAFFYNNRVHDTANWDANGADCDFHHDGIHTFGTTGSSISGLYVYDNYFYGDWGSCPTGFVFIEGGTGTPSHLSNSYWWNNVAIVPSGAVVNTNGWFGIFSGESGVTQIFNNTIIGPNSTDNTACWSIGPVTNLSFKNNLISSCGDPVSIRSSTITSADYNVYGTSCQNLGNCFVWNGAFEGSFKNWQTACGCDSHSAQSDRPGLNSDGSPQSGSAAIGRGANLTGQVTGLLAALALDATKGNTRAASGRPTSTPWDAGAYQYAGTQLSPPTAITVVVH